MLDGLLGSDTFTLEKPGLGPFDACELDAFANADSGNHLQKFYWIQTEH